MKIKKPQYEDAERCISLRKFSKTTGHLSQEDHEFCQKMWKMYPKWYATTEERVFNETVPFGSNVRYKNEKR